MVQERVRRQQWLTLVRADVLLEVVLPAEALVAQRAREGARPAVDAAVAGQLLVAGEALVAAVVVAGEGPLPGVDPQVALQLALVAEGGAALAARELLGAGPSGCGVGVGVLREGVGGRREGRGAE